MTAAALTLPQRRGACPGLSAPMATGDGLLARLMPTGTISLDAMAGLSAAALRYGNRIIEITSRGSIQIRGLTHDSAPAFADAVVGCRAGFAWMVGALRRTSDPAISSRLSSTNIGLRRCDRRVPRRLRMGA